MSRLTFILLCLLVFCIPWQEMAVIPGMTTASVLLGGATLFVAGLAVLIRVRVRKWPPALVVLAFYVVWTLASMFWSISFEHSVARGITFLQVFFFVGLIYQFADTQDRIVWVMLSYIGGASVSLVTLFAELQAVNAPSNGLERLTGGDMNQNDLAATLCIAIVMAAYLAIRPAAKIVLLRKLLWAFVPCAAIGVLLTASRMGIIGLAVDIVVIALMAKVKGIKTIIALLIVACATAYYVPRIVSVQVFDRFAEGTQAHTFQERVEYWRVGLKYWTSHPIQGAGAGCFRLLTESELEKPNVSHNTFVTILVETGVVGFVLAAVFWFLLFKMIRRLPRLERALWLGVFAVWATCSMALTWEYHKDTWLIYGLLMAHYAAILARRSRQASAIPRQFPERSRYDVVRQKENSRSVYP